MRECPFDGCGRLIAPHLFACGQHWRGLPTDLKAQVWQCYDNYREGDITIEQLRREQDRILRDFYSRA